MTKNRASEVDSGRKSIGRQRKGASFPASAGKGELPADYTVLLGQIKERICSERLRVVSAANEAMVLLYWDVGKAILGRQEQEGWGARTIDRLSHDLREAFSDLRGFSPRDLKYMRTFASVWPDRHHVPPDVIRRRFASGLKNFQNMYRHIVDYWQWFDNSGHTLILVDEGENP